RDRDALRREVAQPRAALGVVEPERPRLVEVHADEGVRPHRHATQIRHTLTLDPTSDIRAERTQVALPTPHPGICGRKRDGNARPGLASVREQPAGGGAAALGGLDEAHGPLELLVVGAHLLAQEELALEVGAGALVVARVVAHLAAVRVGERADAGPAL